MKFCQKCGKELHDEAVICPGCGCSINEGEKPVAYNANELVSKKAKASKILGILSVLLLAVLGIPAIILGVMSKNETNGVLCDKAKTGITCGIIALVFWAISIILLSSGVIKMPF